MMSKYRHLIKLISTYPGGQSLQSPRLISLQNIRYIALLLQPLLGHGFDTKGSKALNSKKKSGKPSFNDKWHIFEMDGWNGDYLNMETLAYIEIESNNLGRFQFGLVSGEIDGKVVDHPDGKMFEFTWEGNDECDPASGGGWIRLKDEDQLEGEFRIHMSDDSKFLARRAK